MALTAVAVPRYRAGDDHEAVDASDGDLARAIAARAPGSGGGREELYRRFAPRVRLYGLRHLRDEDAARDLVQQVMLLTIEKLRKASSATWTRLRSFILGTSRMLAVNLKPAQAAAEALRDAFRTALPRLMPRNAVMDEQDLEGACRAGGSRTLGGVPDVLRG